MSSAPTSPQLAVPAKPAAESPAAPQSRLRRAVDWAVTHPQYVQGAVGVIGVILFFWFGLGLDDTGRAHGARPPVGYTYPEGGGPIIGTYTVVDPEDGETYRIDVPYCYHVGTPNMAKQVLHRTDDYARASRAGYGAQARLAVLASQCLSPYTTAGALVLGDDGREQLPALWRLAIDEDPLRGSNPTAMGTWSAYVKAAQALGAPALRAMRSRVDHVFVQPVGSKDIPHEAIDRLPFGLGRTPGFRFVRAVVYDDVKRVFFLRVLDLNVLRTIVLSRWSNGIEKALAELGGRQDETPCVCPAHLGILGSGLFFWPRALDATEGTDWHIYGNVTIVQRSVGATAPVRPPRVRLTLHAFPWGLDTLLPTQEVPLKEPVVESARLEVTPITDFAGDSIAQALVQQYPTRTDLHGTYSRALEMATEDLSMLDYVVYLDRKFVPAVVRTLTRLPQASASLAAPTPANLAIPLVPGTTRINVHGGMPEIERCLRHCQSLEAFLLNVTQPHSTTVSAPDIS